MTQANAYLTRFLICVVIVMGGLLWAAGACFASRYSSDHGFGYFLLAVAGAFGLWFLTWLPAMFRLYTFEGLIHGLPKSYEYKFYLDAGALALDPTNARVAIWDRHAQGGEFAANEILGYNRGTVTRTTTSTGVVPMGDVYVSQTSTSERSVGYVEFRVNNMKTPLIRVWYGKKDALVSNLLARIDIVCHLA